MYVAVKVSRGTQELELRAVNMKLDDFSSSFFHLVTPAKLFLFRFFMFALWTYVMVDSQQYISDGLPWQAFTQWNYFMVGVYFFLALSCSALFLFSDKFKSFPLPLIYISFLTRCTHRIFELEFAGALFVSLLTWIVLLPGSYSWDLEDSLINRSSYFMHAVNAVMMLLEMGLNKLFLRRSGAGMFVGWSLLYGFFHQFFMLKRDLTPGEKPCPVYPFLAVSSPTLIPFLFVLTVAALLCYTLTYQLSRLKLKVAKSMKISSTEKVSRENESPKDQSSGSGGSPPQRTL